MEIGKEFIEYVESMFVGHPDQIRLSKETRELLSNQIHVLKLNRGEFLQMAGVVSMDWGYVKEGLLRIYYNDMDMEITESLVAEGEGFVDFESLFTGKPSNRYIQMLEPTTLYLLPKANLDLSAEGNVEVRMFVLRLLELSLMKVRTRIKNSIFESARDRYEKLLKEKPDVILRVPSIYIASYLGITPETLSRIRSKVK